MDLVGPTAPPATWPLKEWVQDLVLRFVFLDRVLIGGLARTPTYWLGAFFNPHAFLSIIQQVSCTIHNGIFSVFLIYLIPLLSL